MEAGNEYHLRPAEHYVYLSQSGCIHLGNKEDDSEKNKFESLKTAFSILQIPSDMMDGIFKTLSAILWLGNLSFQVILSLSV